MQFMFRGWNFVPLFKKMCILTSESARNVTFLGD
jgi:hypothetical protein